MWLAFSSAGAALSSSVGHVTTSGPSAAAVATHVSTSMTLHQEQPSRRRLAVMCASGPPDGLDSWHEFNGFHDGRLYGAEYRAQQRQLRQSQAQQGTATTAEKATSAQSFLPGGHAGLWTLVFNAGKHNEGVYTQASTSLLAFECTDDAATFAQLLLEKNFGLATAQHWGAAELAAFCEMTQLDVHVVPSGTLPSSPSNTYGIDEHGASDREIISSGNEPNDDKKIKRPSTHERIMQQLRRNSLESSYNNDERMFPGDGNRGGDSHSSYRYWLEELFQMPNDCDDDDHCILR